MSENESKESEGERAREDESKGGEVGGGGGNGGGVGVGGIWGVCADTTPHGALCQCVTVFVQDCVGKERLPTCESVNMCKSKKQKKDCCFSAPLPRHEFLFFSIRPFKIQSHRFDRNQSLLNAHTGLVEGGGWSRGLHLKTLS